VTPPTRATQTTGPDVFEGRRVVGDFEPKLVSRRMALHTIAVHFPRLPQVNGLLCGVERNPSIGGEIHPDVPHTTGLGDDRPEHSVVGVTDVAILGPKERVTCMT